MDNREIQDNTSGTGPGAAVPAEIKRWNWGAFSLTWIWGLGNSTYIAFLAFVPVAGLVMPFVLGAKGSEWAWQNNHWPDVTRFRKTQRLWGWAGLATVLLLSIVIATLATAILTSFHDNGAYKSSLAAIRQDSEVQAVLGPPIKAGWLVMGRIDFDDRGGRALLHYSLSGTRKDGKATVYALYLDGRWTPEQVIVTIPGSGLRIRVITDGHKIHGQISI